MTIGIPFKSFRTTALAGTAVALALTALAPKANAIAIINFGQTASGQTATFTDTSGALSINTTVSVSQIDGGIPATPFNATMLLNATATGAAVNTLGTVSQSYGGTFSISAAGCGTNCLSGTFTGAVVEGENGGSSLSLLATTPPDGNVSSFTSSIVPNGDLGFDRAFSLSFTNPTNTIAICTGAGIAFSSSLCTDSWNFSGNASANVVPVPPPPPSVPEPASMALLGTALVGLGALRRRRG